MSNYSIINVGLNNPDPHGNVQIALANVPVLFEQVEASYLGTPILNRVRLKGLTRLWKDSEVSLRCMANRLGVDPKTVKRYAAKAGLDFPRQGTRITPGMALQLSAHRSESGLGIARRREEWADLRNKCPSDSMTQLRYHAQACYMLYRHDRQWLEKQSTVAKPNKRRARIDSMIVT